MPTTAWVLAGRGRAVNRVSGTGAGWANPGNITADDGSNATYALTAPFGGGFSHWLVGDQFNFSGIPAGATPDGVEILVQLSVDNAAGSTVDTVNIGKDDLTPGTQKTPGTALTTTPTDYGYGSASDLWGFGSISLAELQDPDFQVLISVRVATALATRNFSCDAIWMRVTHTGGAISGDANITEGNDTASADAALEIQGSLSQSEANDTLSGSSGVEIQASLAATEADDVPTAAGALQVTASAFLTEGDDAGGANATLMISANVAITEGDDVPSLSGTIDIVGSAFIAEGNDTLAGNATIGILANAAITEGDDTLSALAQMQIFYPRRGGVDEREEYERKQREWQEDLRRIIDRAFLIAAGIIDPITFELIPPPDYSPVIQTMINEALALDRERAEAFIAEQKRLEQDDAIAVLLLAA